MQPDKRPYAAAASGDAGPEGAPAKQAKVNINPLTGLAYSAQFYELLEKRQRLPAWGARDEFLMLMGGHQTVVLAGEPGAGKTTQLPQILLDAGYHMQGSQVKALVCVQPHGVAAATAAKRVADELEVSLGTYVGYHVRFEDRVGQETLLTFASDDALLGEMVLDPSLERYSVVLLDEVHERTLATDVLLVLLKQCLRRRPELKLVVMSATADIQSVQRHFEGAPMLQLAGNVHPVEAFHMAEPEEDYLRAAVRAVAQVHSTEPEGDILLFLPGADEVELACNHLRKEAVRQASHGELLVLPLHSMLPLGQQQKVFDVVPRPKVAGGRAGRRVVVATSVAETSVAIDGIAYVIDPGLTRQTVYNPRIRLESVLVSPVSRAAASRRAACAGRSRPGKCYRLYTHEAFNEELRESAYPELLRSNLATAVLRLKVLGVDDFVHADFVDPPAPETLMRAIEALNYLGFLDDEGGLTNAGRQAAALRVEPQLARMLLAAPGYRCTEEALSIAAMLCVLPVFTRPSKQGKAADEAKKRFAHLDGDHLTLLNVFHAYKQHTQDGGEVEAFCSKHFLSGWALRSAERARERLKRSLLEVGGTIASTDFQDKEYYPNIRKCVLAGFFMQVAHSDKEKPGAYFTARDSQEAALHPSTALAHKPEWVVYHEFVVTSRGYVRTVTHVWAEWLHEMMPNYHGEKLRA